MEREFKKKYPNATIEWRKYDGDKYVNGLMTAQLIAGRAADIVINQAPAALGKAGFVIDLSDMPFVSREYDTLKSQDLYEGKVYGVPLESVTNGVFYNKRIFAELGIGAPQNWSQLLAACGKIKASGIAPILIGALDSWTANIVGVTIGQAAVYPEDPGFDKAVYEGTEKLDGPAMTRSMLMVEELAKNGYFNEDAFRIGYDEVLRRFADGKGAMVVNGNWFLGDLAADGRLPFDVGFFPIRDREGRTMLIAAGDKKVSVNARSAYPEQAKELASIMFEPDIMSVYLKEANAFSPLTGVTVDYDQQAVREMAGLLAKLPSRRQIGSYWSGAVNDKFGDMIAQTIADRKWSPANLAELQRLYDADKGLLVSRPG